MKSNTIFVVGSSNTDMVVKAKKLPVPGETILGGTFLMNAGGKGANQAVAAARLGGNVALVAKVGDDIFGSQSVEGFNREKINTDYIFIDKCAPSGTALIMVNAEGENCIVVAPGANAFLLPEDINEVEPLFDAEIILMQLEIPIETIEVVAKRAKAFQQKVIINPAPAHHLSDELLDGLFLITPNETEATLLTGIKVEDECSASKAAEFFLRKGVQHVIITLGKSGAFFRDHQMSFIVNAPEVEARDTTAAGDTFNGAIAVALTEGMEWEDAIRFAVEAASVSVTRMGAQASVPYRKEVFA
jgi:ribokinase